MKYRKCLLLSMCLLLMSLARLQAEKIDLEVFNMEKVEKPPESVKLEYKFNTGETRRYDITTSGYGSVNLPGQTAPAKLQMNAKMVFIERVVGIGPAEGTWNLKWEQAEGSMTMKDIGDMPLLIPPIDFVMDKYGAVKEIKGLDQLTSVQGMPQDKSVSDIITQLKSLGFPQKELRLNDSWEQPYKIQLSGGKSITINTTSTLFSYERIMKTDCARIRTTYEVPLSFPIGQNTGAAGSSTSEGDQILLGKEKGEFWTYFAFNEGKVLQAHGTIGLSADLKSASEEKPAEESGDITSDVAKAQHNLIVQYDIISSYNPEPYKPAAANDKKNGKNSKEGKDL